MKAYPYDKGPMVSRSKKWTIYSNPNWSVQCRPFLLLSVFILFALGLLMPYLFQDVVNLLIGALHTSDTGALLEGAILLTFINTFRSVPNYFCVLAVSMAFVISYQGKRRLLLEAVLLILPAFLLIRFVYSLIYYVYSVEYGWGIHTISIVAFIIYLHTRDIESIKLPLTLLIMTLFISGVQFLDLIPALTRFGMGKGELSMYVKNSTVLLDSVRVITLFAATAFFVFFVNSFIILQLSLDEHKLRLATEKERELEKRLYESRMQAVQMRSFREIQSLVHDLKAPLTTICGLSDLSALMVENGQVREYQQRISRSTDKMSNMISEILYEDHRTSVTIEALVKQVLTYLPEDDRKSILQVEILCPQAQVHVNSIRMVRAFVNLIENARVAVEGNPIGRILLSIRETGEWVHFQVWDNGRGIDPTDLKRIWDLGYSGSHSTGLGLGFVHGVVEDHGGTIEIDSQKGAYTNVTVRIRREEHGIQHSDH